MNSRLFKPVAAILLAIGIASAGVAPASAGTVTVLKAPTHSTNDTGWGFK